MDTDVSAKRLPEKLRKRKELNYNRQYEIQRIGD
jgi:hypothetical protein